MTKKIAVIDPYMVTPSLSCFNHLVNLVGSPIHYHLPQVTGHKTLEEYPADGYIVLGSASHIFQNLSWHQPLADFLMAQLQKNIPVLGICFGHQLLCHAFGSELGFYRPDEFKLSGVRDVTITKDVMGLKAGEKLTLTVAHRQIVTKLAPCLEEVGRDDQLALSFDLVRHRELPFLGVQPHPEAIPNYCNTERPANADEHVSNSRRDGNKLITSFLKHHRLMAPA